MELTKWRDVIKVKKNSLPSDLIPRDHRPFGPKRPKPLDFGADHQTFA